MIEDELQEIFNNEIARELMTEANPDVNDADIEYIYSNCEGNPWNAVILYFLILETEKMLK